MFLKAGFRRFKDSRTNVRHMSSMHETIMMRTNKGRTVPQGCCDHRIMNTVVVC